MTLSEENLKDMVEAQLAAWPLAKANQDLLAKCRRRPFQLGDLRGFLQWNPARINSTSADISPDAVKARRCFLCKENRPDEQFAIEPEPGWELLVNPYPVFPFHFTICAKDHRPQRDVPLEIVSIAEKMPGMAIFFNGAKAGASAPDHLHLQGVLAVELPLVGLLAETHSSAESGIKTASVLGLDLPFKVESGIIRPDAEGMRTLARMTRPNGGLLNMYAFLREDGYMQLLRIERRAHRPRRYGCQNPGGILVSPGSLEMAGIVITPRKEDFESITDQDLREIYSDCGIPS